MPKAMKPWATSIAVDGAAVGGDREIAEGVVLCAYASPTERGRDSNEGNILPCVGIRLEESVVETEEVYIRQQASAPERGGREGNQVDQPSSIS